MEIKEQKTKKHQVATTKRVWEKYQFTMHDFNKCTPYVYFCLSNAVQCICIEQKIAIKI